VNVVRHASAIAATVKTFVCGDSLPLGHGGGHGDTVWLAVEDHDGVTGELSGTIYEKSGVAA